MRSELSPKRPYLLRAYFDWLVDNELTPYLVVDAEYQGVNVPQDYVKDGQIVLNLSANAVGNLAIRQDAIQFSARFRGIPQDIYIPMGAALAIYARENGDGVMFEPEHYYDEVGADQPTGFNEIVEPSPATVKPQEVNTKKPEIPDYLRLIK